MEPQNGAQALGISRTTLFNKMRRFDLFESPPPNALPERPGRNLLRQRSRCNATPVPQFRA